MRPSLHRLHHQRDMNILLVLLHVVIVFSFNQNSTIKLVHVFFRHGIRIPDEHELYPSHERYQFYKRMGFGQLTNTGKLRSYQLGEVLRNRYNAFLGEHFEHNSVFIKSTYMERTKITALLVLAGLFPPSKKDKWNEHLNWNPIPITHNDDTDYELRRPMNYCPVYFCEYNKVFGSEEVRKLEEKYKQTFEVATNNTGKTYTTIRDIFLLHQLIHIEKNMNVTLPAWAVEVFPDLRNIAMMQCYFENSNSLLKKLSGGRMLAKVVQNMKEKIRNTLQPSVRKIFLYSGHEYTIFNTLASLNLHQVHFPNFNAAVCIELHQNPTTGRYYVQVFYIKDVFDIPEAEFIPGCGHTCEFNDFVHVLSPNLPLNYTEECESTKYLD